MIASLGVGCSAPRGPELHDGPILIITIDALRADTLGALGGEPALTPNLDALAAEADWAERAVAASSWTVPSMAAIHTGRQPWRNGNWHSGRPVLSEEQVTLAEAVQGVGYRTVAFRSNTWLRAKFGYDQGFDDFFSLGQRKRAKARLEAVDGGRELIWAHVLPPHAPYVHRPELAEQVVDAPASLPERVRALELEPYFDPEVELPQAEKDVYWALYRFNVAWADQVVGELFDSLRKSGHWDDALIFVTSDHGEEFGENRQITHGGSLTRVLLEVPLLIKLPRDSEWRLEPRPWVANHRLYSTVLEMVGAEPHSAALPSLWTLTGGEARDDAVLSELYQGNGVNSFSFVDNGAQLLWRSRFAPSESDYFAARLATMGGRNVSTLEAPELVFSRLSDAFLEAKPLFGNVEEDPDLELHIWQASDGPEDRAVLARRLRREWQRWNGDERAPAEMALEGAVELSAEERDRLRSLGYAVD